MSDEDDVFCIVCDEPIPAGEPYWEFDGEPWCDRCKSLDQPGTVTRINPREDPPVERCEHDWKDLSAVSVRNTPAGRVAYCPKCRGVAPASVLDEAHDNGSGNDGGTA